MAARFYMHSISHHTNDIFVFHGTYDAAYFLKLHMIFYAYETGALEVFCILLSFNRVLCLKLGLNRLTRYALPHHICLLLSEQGCLPVAYLRGRTMLDLEHEINLLKRKSLGLDVEEVYDWKPCKIKHSKNDVESPSNVCDGFADISMSGSWELGRSIGDRLTTWRDQDNHVDEKPICDHGDRISNAAHSRGVDLRRVKEWDTEE